MTATQFTNAPHAQESDEMSLRVANPGQEVRATIAAGQHLPQILDESQSKTRLRGRQLVRQLRERSPLPDATTMMRKT